jgi:penicillin-binding protein 1A
MAGSERRRYELSADPRAFRGAAKADAPKPPPKPAPKPAKEKAKKEKPRRESAPPRESGGFFAALGRLIALTCIWGGIAAALVLGGFWLTLPDVAKTAQLERRPTVVALAADGTEFARFGDFHGAVIPASGLPAHLVNAVLAIEDRRFRSHFGIDPIGLGRAFYTNWKTGRPTQGGSTITQQLAKNLFLTGEKSMTRKIHEAMLALWLERRFSKEEILTSYLNRVYLGAGAYGVDAAARTYFGKPATQVDLLEAAMIAGLLKAPSRYAPSSNPNESLERAKVVLGAMVDAGHITDEQRLAALSAPPSQPQKPGGDGRYFADWITDLVADFVGPEHGDVVVRTTLDLNMQRAAEQHIRDMLDGPGAKADVGQAALVAMSNDGAVRALVGGRNFGASEYNRAIQAKRQPGSAFKPFLYLAALEAGRRPDDMIEDAPVNIGGWSPGNYDGKFRGSITLSQALAHSSNTAAARLISATGAEAVRRTASQLGISSKLTKDLSLALGTSEVSLMELTRAYAGIARLGRPVQAYAVMEIRGRDGSILYRRQGSGAGQVVNPHSAAGLIGMMSDVVRYGSGVGAKLDRPAAGKTGTTQDYHDAWFVGFTGDLVAGVWLGNDDNREMKKVTGGGLPAKLWRSFMLDAHKGMPPRPLPDGSGMDMAYAPASNSAASSAAAKPAGGGIGGLIEQMMRQGAAEGRN